MADSVQKTTPHQVGRVCFVAWLIAEACVFAVALAQGVPPSTFFRSSEDGRISLWQALMFSVSLSPFGFWMALTTKLRRIPEDPAAIAYSLKLYAKGGGWIFAIGGIISTLRIIGLMSH